MAIYDNYNLRFNTANQLLEMNTGAETWIPVPDTIAPAEIALANTQILIGNASNVAVANAMSGGATISNTGVLTLTNSSVTGQALTGFVSGAGTVSATDTILTAANKFNGNIALKYNSTGGDIVPAANSTSTMSVKRQDGTTNVINVDTTNQILSVGTIATDGDLTVKKAPGDGSSVSIFCQNSSTGGTANVKSQNQTGDVLQLVSVGSTFSVAELQRMTLLQSNSTTGTRIVSTDASAKMYFAMGGALAANDKMALDSTGALSVGTTSANAAAIVQADSTTRGFLPPRMTEAQRDAIATPPAGLMIYNTTTNKLNVYTTAWEVITSA